MMAILASTRVCLVVLALPLAAYAQATSSSTPPQPAAPQDALGRSTPRGTVLAFLYAARRGENELARQYLNTRLSGEAGQTLAHELYVVLDARLPARLTQISDAPEGSRSNPLAPNQELVGAISSRAGTIEILLDRMERGGTGPIWLFSARTLDSIPAVYEEVVQSQGGGVLTRALTSTRVGGVRLLEWLSLLLGFVVVYFATVLLNRILTPLIRLTWRRVFRGSDLFERDVLPAPARLLLLALASRWLLATLPLSLLMRQFWSNAASLVTIVSVVWLLILLNGRVEDYLRARLRADVAATVSLLRLVRRAVDVLVIFGGLLAMLRYFGVDPTPALAGLGVGGIAVALAAQKTLENVIAGASLIFDQAVRVGDFLKVGEIQGTIDHIGLRSTRLRTLDRTVVSVPNSQIANMTLETFSMRDKFWFHPVVGLRYETTPTQLRAVVDGIRGLLAAHPSVDRESVRVRFIRLGSFSLDIDVFAYVYARDWNHFLEIQEQLLFSVTEAVRAAGTEIAFPSQTMYLANAAGALEPAGVQKRF